MTDADLAPKEKIAPYFVLVAACLLALLTLVHLAALSRARTNPKVLKRGYGFLRYLLFGALCGQAFLIVHSLQYLVGNIGGFLACNVQFLLLVLHFDLMLSPVLAKLLRIDRKLRHSRIRPERLATWDRMARRVARCLISFELLLASVHLLVLGITEQSGQLEQCAESQGDLDPLEIGLFSAHVASLGVLLCAAWLVTWRVSRSRFSPLFVEFGALKQSTLLLSIAFALGASSIYSTRIASRLVQQFLSVQLLSVFLVVSFTWQALRRTLVPPWMQQCLGCCRTTHAPDVELRRAIELHTFLLDKTTGKAERHATRLADLKMQQKLLSLLPRLGPHRVSFRALPDHAGVNTTAGGRSTSNSAAAPAEPAALPPLNLRASSYSEWTEGLAELRRDGTLELREALDPPPASALLRTAHRAEPDAHGVAGSSRRSRRLCGRLLARLGNSSGLSTEASVPAPPEQGEGDDTATPSPSPEADLEAASPPAVAHKLMSLEHGRRVLIKPANLGMRDGAKRVKLPENGGHAVEIVALVSTTKRRRISLPGRVRCSTRSWTKPRALLRAPPPHATWQLRFSDDGLEARWLAQLDGTAGLLPSVRSREGVAAVAVPREIVSPRPPCSLRVWAGTWNAGGLGPPYDAVRVDELRSWLLPEAAGERAEVYAVGFQELNEFPGNLGKGESMGDLLLEVLGPDEYVLAVPGGKGMHQMRLFVFLKREALQEHLGAAVGTAHVGLFRPDYRVRSVPHADVSGRKGGVSISLRLGRTRLCFVSCHLEAHQGDRGELHERNRHVASVLHRGLPEAEQASLADAPDDPCLAFDHVVLMGDLNYRLGPPYHSDDDGGPPVPRNADSTPGGQQYWAEVVSEIAMGNWAALHDRDQLRRQAEAGRALSGFELGQAVSGFEPDFMPTFKQCEAGHKHATGSEVPSRERRYDRRRIPSYTDRVLVHSVAGAGCVRERQGAAEKLRASDHTPVWARFTLNYRLPWPEPHPQFLHDMEEFARHWHLELRAVKVVVDVASLLDKSSAWYHVWGRGWPSPREKQPKLLLELEAPFFARGRERLTRKRGVASAAPPPAAPAPAASASGLRLPAAATLSCSWEGGRFAVSPRWAAAMRGWMHEQQQLAAGEYKPTSWRQPALDFLRSDGATLRLHVSAYVSDQQIPLGSACVSAADLVFPPSAESPGALGPEPSDAPGVLQRLGSLLTGVEHARRERSSTPTGLQTLEGRDEPLLWCGVRCGTLDVGCTLHVPKFTPAQLGPPSSGVRSPLRTSLGRPRWATLPRKAQSCAVLEERGTGSGAAPRSSSAASPVRSGSPAVPPPPTTPPPPLTPDQREAAPEVLLPRHCATDSGSEKLVELNQV